MPNNQEKLRGKQDVAEWIIEEWTAKLATSIETMTELRPGITVGVRIPTDNPEAPRDALWYSIPLTLATDAAIFIGATGETWRQIGKSALVAAGIPDSSETDDRATYLEILTQATSGAVQSLAERLERSIICLPAKEVTFAELTAAAGFVPVDIFIPEPPTPRIYLAWSHALGVQLSAANAPEHNDHGPAEAAKHPALEKSRTLDLLMEVELPVSVSFGRADLPLRDVLKLNSGSIVELNRTISDPVEIIVNNCVIARGEVVVVEGNYGVRIQQVVSREERLRTLK